MRSIFSLLIPLLFSFVSYCQQKPLTYYFDKDLNLTSKSNALYTGVGTKDKDLFRLELYETKKNYHVFSAHYTDSTLVVMEGRFISYYQNGTIENLSYYKNGLASGLWLKWDLDQKIIDSVWYNNGKPDSSVNLYYGLGSKKLISIVKDNYIDSSTITLRFDKNEHLIPPVTADTVTREQEIIVDKPDTKILFPGGDSLMNNYFQEEFDRSLFDLLKSASSGICHVKFTVDKNGNPDNLDIIYCDNGIFANVFKKAIRNITWIPAVKNGKKVTASKDVSAEFYPSLTGLTANDEKKYFFNEDFNAVSADKANYSGKLTMDNNLSKFTVHYIRQSNRIFSMHFTDPSLQTCNGEFESFYYDDQKFMRGNFLLGRKNGVWLRWSENGQIIDSTIYNLGIVTYETSLTYQPEGGLVSMYTIDYNAGTERRVYYDKRSITSDVTINIDKDEDSSVNKIFTKVDVASTFPGGAVAWKNYLDSYFQNEKDKVHRAGVCVVRFVVDSSGQVSQPEALTLPGSSIARFAVKAVSNSPNWIPGTLHGRKVKSYITLTVNVYDLRL